MFGRNSYKSSDFMSRETVEVFLPGAAAITCAGAAISWSSDSAAVVVGAGSATAAAVAAADGRVTVAELVKVTVDVDGVAANQHCRREVGCDEHVGAVRCRHRRRRCRVRVSFESRLFRVFDRRGDFLPPPVGHPQDGRRHPALVPAVLDAAAQRMVQPLLAIQLKQRVQDFDPLGGKDHEILNSVQ